MVEKDNKIEGSVQNLSESLKKVLTVDKTEADKKAHKFWDTQPVLKRNTDDSKKEDVAIEPVDVEKKITDVRQDPYQLPKGFEWTIIDVESDEALEEVYYLLTHNYVEDDDNMFRFDYSKEFLRWALRPPGFKKDWIIGIKSSVNQTLLAMITGIPAKVHVSKESFDMAEINFLCVHKKLRSKRIAPVLIKEITRRVNLTGRWQAVYTAGVVIPTPVAKCRYYHRSINPQKLVSVKFTGLGPRMTMKRLIRLCKLPEKPKISGLRKMEKKDVASVTSLLKTYLAKFKVWIEWDDHEVDHWMLERSGVVNSYVVENSDGVITDFCSFYHIPSTVIGNEKYKTLNAAYSFYNVATSVSLTDLMQDSLTMASIVGVDVFNCLDLLDNREFLEKLRFGKGDGFLHYYIFNLRCAFMNPEDVGIVLL